VPPSAHPVPSFLEPLTFLLLLTTSKMSNDGELSHPRGMSLKQAYEMRMNNAIVVVQEQVRKLTV